MVIIVNMKKEQWIRMMYNNAQRRILTEKEDDEFYNRLSRMWDEMEREQNIYIKR